MYGYLPLTIRLFEPLSICAYLALRITGMARSHTGPSTFVGLCPVDEALKALFQALDEVLNAMPDKWIRERHPAYIAWDNCKAQADAIRRTTTEEVPHAHVE